MKSEMLGGWDPVPAGAARKIPAAHDLIRVLLVEVRDYLQDRMNRANMVEQLEVQLAGCGAAALGHGVVTGVAVADGEYGWSASYEDVLSLRQKYEYAKTILREFLSDARVRAAVGDAEAVRIVQDVLDTEELPPAAKAKMAELFPQQEEWEPQTYKMGSYLTDLILWLFNSGKLRSIAVSDIAKEISPGAYGNYRKLTRAPWAVIIVKGGGYIRLTERGVAFASGKLKIADTVLHENKDDENYVVSPDTDYRDIWAIRGGIAVEADDA